MFNILINIYLIVTKYSFNSVYFLFRKMLRLVDISLIYIQIFFLIIIGIFFNFNSKFMNSYLKSVYKYIINTWIFLTTFVSKPFLAGKLFIENKTTVDRATICILSETWLAINDEIRRYFSQSFEISFRLLHIQDFFLNFPFAKNSHCYITMSQMSRSRLIPLLN